jgi:hypothetical protein
MLTAHVKIYSFTAMLFTQMVSYLAKYSNNQTRGGLWGLWGFINF